MGKGTCIRIKGLRVNNLKNISIDIPHNRLIVITGLSGSGKSSLAFDTLYAEGQQRYIESMSAYARQFMGKIHKPDADLITGIPPAIAIEQKVNIRNPRSTLGTATEIYEYVKLLFARLGKTYSPISGELVSRDSVKDVCNYIFSFPEERRFTLYAPFRPAAGRTPEEHLRLLLQQGYTRVSTLEGIVPIEELLEHPLPDAASIRLLIDRFTASQDDENRARVAESVETAFFEGNGQCSLESDDPSESKRHTSFSNLFEKDGILFKKPSTNMFSFNTPYGACPNCGGFGSTIGIDPDLVIPDKSLSVYEDAIACWRTEKMSAYRDELISSAAASGFPIHRPIEKLGEKEYGLLWSGNQYFHGLDYFFQWLEENSYKIQYRILLSRYKGKTTCPVCHGSRLNKETEYVRVGGKNIQEIMRSADQVIDTGPYSGSQGGNIVFQGSVPELLESKESITAAFLRGERQIPVPDYRRPAHKFLRLENVSLHNIHNLSVEIPLEVLTVVSGVSGSGKSTLVRDLLFPALQRMMNQRKLSGNRFDDIHLKGDLSAIGAVSFVDQNPIGRSSRSNPATYIGAFDHIRQLFAEQPLSKARGYKPGFFSFNVEGGRCENCQGEGHLKIKMQFMSDIEIPCEECKGKCYKDEALEVKVNGKSIADILQMTISEAAAFFGEMKEDKTAQNICNSLQPLLDVGLGYLQMAQSSSTLSGGEAQRIKLAYFLGKGRSQEKTLLIFDEPTTGLHFHDVQNLYKTFEALLQQGHSILVIEHHLDIIKCADWVIEMGPEGGDKGGQVIFTGTPEELCHCETSFTAPYLSEKLTNNLK